VKVLRAQDTFLAGLIGAGITASPTPVLHEREADHHGFRYLYRILDLPTLGLRVDQVEDLVRHARLLGYSGLNVTYPAKQVVIPHLDKLDAVSSSLGAVNTIVIEDDGRLVGYNTDADAFGEAVAERLGDLTSDRVLQLGAGGAGAATAYALLSRGIRTMHITDVDHPRADALCRRMAERFPDVHIEAISEDRVAEVAQEATGLVNATPVGTWHTPGAPLSAALLRPSHWVVEVIYQPLRTELLQSAEALGCRTVDGGQMMVNQAAYSYRCFTGTAADRDRMSKHFRQLAGQTP
jgi:shikimate dehydrogenase